jgi:hypothetical protein
MRLFGKTSLALLLIALSMSVAVPVIADEEAPPADYTKETENGKYIFVMLAPERPHRVSKNDEIRALYKHSGLYNKTGTYEPLWQVFWYSFTVYPSSDGKHVVRMGPWAQTTSDLAIAFYAEGKELKQYAISDLVEDINKLKYTVSHFFWRTDIKYNDKEGTVFLKTVDGISYTFSVKTGEIIDKKP